MSAAGKNDGWDAGATISVDGEGADPGPPPSSTGTHETGDGGVPGEALDDVGGSLVRGAPIGRYLVLELLGAGAMGVAYAAYDPELDRKVALKLLRPQRAAGDVARRQARLVREAKAIAKVSHPNVVGIFDVGVHEGQVFMAMEYLAGGTLADWMAAKKRPWRETVRMFLEVGKGLAGAHVEGLVHRDFKPDNVLLDKNGTPKVVDFGLVRLAADRELTASSAMDEDARAATESMAPVPPAADAALTRTGALTGTPAYMAAEQFLGKPVEARTDQFAFCVALYEALYGERPFAGATVVQLGSAVTNGEIVPTARDADVPGWVRRAVVTGLAIEPASRHPTMDALLAILLKDPAVALRRRLWTGGGVSAALVAALLIRHQFVARHEDLERAVRAHVEAGQASAVAGDRLDARALTTRQRAFASFDAGDLAGGERLWAEVLAAERSQESAYAAALGSFDAARTLDPDGDVQSLSAEAAARLLALHERRWQSAGDEALRKRLDADDVGGAVRARAFAPASLTVATEPGGAKVRLARLVASGASGGRREARSVAIEGGDTTPTAARALDAGSYQLELRAEGRAPVSFPFVVRRGETLAVTIAMPAAASVPQNFVYVPAGEFLFGTRDESLRKSFLDTVPIHRVRTAAFLIAKNETTFGEWITFLRSLPPAERSKYLPGAGETNAGKVQLRPVGAQGWELSFQPWSAMMKVRDGQRLIYEGRQTLATHDWSRLPVTGIGVHEAEVYARWLSATARVPGARLCDEREWERAARGADDREYPQGDQLDPSDANFDESFGKDPRLFGLEEVGLRPASRSVFGVDDMVGNAFEFTRSFLSPGEFVVRGGNYFQNANAARSANRALIDVTTRGQSIGVRICADAS